MVFGAGLVAGLVAGVTASRHALTIFSGNAFSAFITLSTGFCTAVDCGIGLGFVGGFGLGFAGGFGGGFAGGFGIGLFSGICSDILSVLSAIEFREPIGWIRENGSTGSELPFPRNNPDFAIIAFSRVELQTGSTLYAGTVTGMSTGMGIENG